MKMQNIKEIDKEFVAPTYARFDLALCRGKGSLVYDESGKEYIDLATGIAVNTFGVSDDWSIAAYRNTLVTVIKVAVIIRESEG